MVESIKSIRKRKRERKVVYFARIELQKEVNRNKYFKLRSMFPAIIIYFQTIKHY
jgi:hypothetical protein